MIVGDSGGTSTVTTVTLLALVLRPGAEMPWPVTTLDAG